MLDPKSGSQTFIPLLETLHSSHCTNTSTCFNVVLKAKERQRNVNSFSQLEGERLPKLHGKLVGDFFVRFKTLENQRHKNIILYLLGGGGERGHWTNIEGHSTSIY